MLQRIRLEINTNNMLKAKDRVVLGVSGGADSVFLLHVMQQLSREMEISLSVVHVNHGIREEDAVEDALFVKQLCEEYEIDFHLFEDDVPALAREWGMSEEEAGRKIRYQHFYDVAKEQGATKIATAHHQGDQVETILFHLIRGSKLAGMRGMAPITVVKEQGLELIRPMLTISKNEILEWLREHSYTWREDVTNQDNRYARNKLRNEVIPLLEEINERSAEHIIEFAQNASIWQEYAQQQVARYWTENIEPGRIAKGETVEYILNREKLRQQPKVFAQEVIYQLITTLAGKKQDITGEHVEAIFRLLFAQSGKQVNLPYEMMADTSYEKLRIRKCLQLEEAFLVSKEEYRIPLDEEVQLPCEQGVLSASVVNLEELDIQVRESFLADITNSKNIYTKGFDCDTINSTPCVRTPETDDYFVINDSGNRKRLSRYFIDCKIPKDERDRMYVVADGNEILWLVGHRRCNNHKITEKTKRVLVLKWVHKGDKNGKAN